MAKVAEVIGGAALLVVGAVIMDGLTWGSGTAFLPLIFSAAGSLTMAGLGGLLASTPQPGVAMASRNPIGAWTYVYGRYKVGGTCIFDTSNSSQGTSNDKQLHRIYVLACHETVGGYTTWDLRIDGQVITNVYLGNVNGADQFHSVTPTQLSASITSITRTSGLVTINLASAITTAADGQSIWIQNVADNSFNGIFICALTSPTTLTCVNGGADTTSSGGTVWTTFPDYKDKIYYEFQNGAQTATFQGLLNSGTQWGSGGTDIISGRTAAYIRMGYDATVFSGGVPGVSFVIGGKGDILDPRTGTRGWTENAALVIADFMSLPPAKGGFGLPIATSGTGLYIDQAQLIAAANICDEAVNLAVGGTQPRYTCNTSFSLAETRGSILAKLLSSCGGRITREGGAYKIFPAAWAGSSFSVTVHDLRGPIRIKPLMSARDICNGVKGVYVAVSNGYQQADIPPYAQDVLHGYASDANQAMDGGDRIWKEVNFACTNNAPMAQRLAKIDLLRTRRQLRCTVRLSMRAWAVVAQDVIDITFARYGWVAKTFEVLNARLVTEKQQGESAPALCIELDIAETDANIYDWSVTEELNVQATVAVAQTNTLICPYPQGVQLYSGPGATISGEVYPGTIRTTASGISTNGLCVAWVDPNDGYVINGGSIEVQYKLSTDTLWTAFGQFSPGVQSCYIPNLSDGNVYYVQVRAINCAGTPSNWVEAGPETISNTQSIVAYSGVAVAPEGTLTSRADPGGTAEIDVAAGFTATLLSQTASCTSGASITGLVQGATYSVYYVDPYFSGGTIAPIATLSPSDYLNKAGYYLIGVIATPYGSATYMPSSGVDVGQTTTLNGAYAYDSNPTSCAVVTSTYNSHVSGSSPLVGNCVFAGFLPVVTTSTLTLTVVVAVHFLSGSGAVTVSLGGGIIATVATYTVANVGGASYTATYSIPAGTSLNTLSVSVESDCTSSTTSTSTVGAVTAAVYSIFIS